MTDLRRLRQMLDASIYDVAERADTTAATISRLETGHRRGRPATRAKVAAAMGQLVNEHLRESEHEREQKRLRELAERRERQLERKRDWQRDYMRRRRAAERDQPLGV